MSDIDTKTTPLGPEALIAMKQEFLVPCTGHFFQRPPQLVRGEGAYLFDSEGRRYLDGYAGVSVVGAGHCHPDIVRAMTEQAVTLQHTTTIYLTQPMLEVAARLAELAPGSISKTFFCSSGTEANEMALLTAKLATGRSEFVALEQGLHGRTALALAVTGLDFWRADPAPPPGVRFAPNAYCYRCPLNKTYPSCELACADAVETVLEASPEGPPAALIAEPIQGNGGIVTPPPGYFEKLRTACDRAGTLLILDEVQTAFNRTGRMFAAEHWDIQPDLLTVAKALGNGQPVAAMLSTPEVAGAWKRPSASTFGGNLVSMSVAKATLEVHERERLGEQARRVGEWLRDRLEWLQQRHPVIGDVRGKGLMLGMELVRNKAKAPAIEEMDRLLEALKDEGFLLGRTGPHRNVLTFMPPLVVIEEDLRPLVETLDWLFGHLEKGGPQTKGRL